MFFCLFDKLNHVKFFAMNLKYHDEALRTARNYLASESPLLKALIEVDQDRTFLKFKMTHLKSYCVKILGLSDAVAEAFVRIVRKSHDVPELAQAVIADEGSVYKAKTIASAITSTNCKEWIEKAKTTPKALLERQVANANGVETKRRTFDMTFDDCDLLKRCQDIHSTNSREFKTEEETLSWAMNIALDKHDPVQCSDRSQGWSREMEVTRRDRDLCQELMPDGTICGEGKWTHQHHIQPLSMGGPDTPENVITLCSSHHRMVHSEARLSTCRSISDQR